MVNSNHSFSNHSQFTSKTAKKVSAYELHSRAEKLIQASSNRYQVSVQVARRAQRIKAEIFESDEDLAVMPVIQAIIEISDELSSPELISDH